MYLGHSYVRISLPRVVGAALGAACLLLAACAPEAQTEYTQDTDTNFFASCVDPIQDALIQTRLCQCVYRRLQVVVPYERLEVLDDEMVANEELKLPDELVEIVASCVIEETKLQG